MVQREILIFPIYWFTSVRHHTAKQPYNLGQYISNTSGHRNNDNNKRSKAQLLENNNDDTAGFSSVIKGGLGLTILKLIGTKTTSKQLNSKVEERWKVAGPQSDWTKYPKIDSPFGETHRVVGSHMWNINPECTKCLFSDNSQS